MKAGMWFSLAGLLALGACQGDELSKTPQISNLALDRQSIARKGDTVHLRLDFTDGNGDLNPPAWLYVRNTSKPDSATKFDISRNIADYVDPELGVRGVSYLTLPSSFPFFAFKDTAKRRDTAILEVYLRDQGGSKSNTLTSLPLILIND